MNTIHNLERGFSRSVAVVSVALIAAVLAVYYISRPEEQLMMESPSPSAMMEKSPSPSVMMEKSPEPEKMMKDDNESGVRASVAEYTQSSYAEAIASGRVVALYYYANWCPVCKAEFPKFVGAVGVLSDDSLAAFRVNYNDSETTDDERASAKQFQVGSQHTLVIVKDGSVLSKELVSGETQDSFEAKLTQAIR